jgi:hypothetical protein
VLTVPTGVVTDTPPVLLTLTPFEIRQIPNMTAHTDKIPSPTNTPTIIRMIFSALLPPPVGAGCTATGAPGAFEAGGT